MDAESNQKDVKAQETVAKKGADVKASAEIKESKKKNPKLELADQKLLDKDKDIEALKAKLAESQEINKAKKGDIRAETNRQGDPKLIKIGKNSTGQAEWRKANELTDADIERRNKYIAEIKQNNAKKY